MRHNTHRGITIGLCLVLLFAGVVPAPAAAQTDDEGLGNAVLGAAIDAAEDPRAAASSFVGWASGISANVQASVGDPERTPAECAGALQSELNSHNDTYEQYINDRLSASTSRNVIRIDCRQERDGETTTETVFLVADVSDGNYTNAQVVDSTDRSVDERIVLTGVATEAASDDLQTFREEYASANETPPPSYKGKVKGKYMGHVEGTFGFLPAIEEDE